MKRILIVIISIAGILQSCNKENAGSEGFDFSNNIPPYVELTSTKAITLAQGNDTTFVFQMRTAFQETVTVTYDVMGGGLNLTNQTVVIDRNKFTAIATVNIPNNVIVPPATTATATLTLIKAQTAAGRLLTIGAKNNPATQKVTINITQ